MQPIETHPSRTEQVYRAILDEICDGTLAPGTHLVQEELAARLGVSRQPVQQAMQLLKSDGLVQELGARGLYVAPLDAESTDQHYEIRAALDELAARRAAERVRASADAARSIAATGEAIMQAGRAAIAAGDLRAMIRQDIRFHEFLYDASGNPLLVDTARPHWRYLQRVMAEVLRFAEPGTAVWQQHRAILDAVLAGDADEAAARARFHVREAAGRLARASHRGRAALGVM